MHRRPVSGSVAGNEEGGGFRRYGIRSVLTDGALVASNYICDNAKAGIAVERNAGCVEVEGNFIDARAGQRAVQDATVKRG